MNPYPLLADLAACLCATFEEACPSVFVEPLCFCGVTPGDSVTYEYTSYGCDEADGQAWVRLTQAYPSTNFPNPSAGTDTPCSTDLALLIEVGCVRTIKLDTDMTGEPTPPDAATWAAYSEIQMAEFELMQQAILCCFKTKAILATYSPIGPLGGVIGGIWALAIPSDPEED